MKKIGSLVVVAIFSIFALGALAGCVSTAKKDQGTASSETGLRVAFSDFEDIPLPSKVSLNKSKTLLYSAGNLTCSQRFLLQNNYAQLPVKVFLAGVPQLVAGDDGDRVFLSVNDPC